MPRDKYTNLSDAEILDKYAADNDTEWLGILLERYTTLLFGVCMKYLKNPDDAKDAVQQVFLKAISEIPRYKVTYFKSWIYIIAKNHCLLVLRDKGHKSVEISEKMVVADSGHSDNDNNFYEQIHGEVLEMHMGKLNEQQRSCVALFYLEKKSYREISELTGYSMLDVKSYIQNGKRNLKIMLTSYLKNEQKNS